MAVRFSQKQVTVKDPPNSHGAIITTFMSSNPKNSSTTIMLSHQTKEINTAYELESLLRVALVLRERHIGQAQPWEITINKGSVSIYNEEQGHGHERIVCFIDKGDKLSQRVGLTLDHGETEPVVVAIELTAYPVRIQEQMREWLANNFRYIHDTLVAIKPYPTHHYDIVFLKPGYCSNGVINEDELKRAIEEWKSKNNAD